MNKYYYRKDKCPKCKELLNVFEDDISIYKACTCGYYKELRKEDMDEQIA